MLILVIVDSHSYLSNTKYYKLGCQATKLVCVVGCLFLYYKVLVIVTEVEDVEAYISQLR